MPSCCSFSVSSYPLLLVSSLLVFLPARPPPTLKALQPRRSFSTARSLLPAPFLCLLLECSCQSGCCRKYAPANETNEGELSEDCSCRLLAARLATALPLSVAASRRAWVACPNRAGSAPRERAAPLNRAAPSRVTLPACRAADPNPARSVPPRGCHAGCLREPLRASQRRPSFHRRCLVLAQHTTAVKQSAPPRGASRRGTPRGTPPRPPAAAAHFTLPRVVCCSAQPSRQPPREPGPNQTRPGAALPLPPAPLKWVGVPPRVGWSDGAPCAPTMKPAQRAPPH